MAHSAYFSPAQMLNYAENFVEHDEWSNFGKEPGFANRICNTKEFVAPAVYERSIFYNEWIRAMGDDTFHCIGTVMETGCGLGLIGLHRGKSQTDFDVRSIGDLDRNIVHLRRMLTMRARLASDLTRISGLTALLDGNPAPMLAATSQGRIVYANPAAEALFTRGTMIRQIGCHIVAASPEGRSRLARAIARASDPAAPEASAVTLGEAGREQLELTVAPGRDRSTRLVLITGHDPDARLRAALERADGGDRLAPRELMVARLAGAGLRNREIAVRMGLSEGTVKVYLHTVFAKVGVTNRTELALLIGGA